jgi:hypothetical protein
MTAGLVQHTKPARRVGHMTNNYCRATMVDQEDERRAARRVDEDGSYLSGVIAPSVASPAVFQVHVKLARAFV